MSRILGIDYGKVRTGIAITDELGITAQGMETINSNGNDKIILKRLAEIVEQYNIETFVIGNPLNMDGSESERSIITKDFIHKLKSSSILYCLIFLCAKMYNLIRLYMRSQYEALHKLR